MNMTQKELNAVLAAHKEWALDITKGKRANLSGADLSWANLPFNIETDATLKQKILEKVEAEGCSLEMSDWHTCGTTHCLAGWAVVLSGEAGKELEAKSTTYLAGRLLLGLDAKQADIFYTDDDAAMEWLKA